MANIRLFRSFPGSHVPRADAHNEAGGAAYTRDPKSALALYAATGCLNNTFYANAGEQLDHVLQLAAQVPARFVAQTAIYARQRGHMKDMPALLLATLAVRDGKLLEAAFDQVIDNGRMLRNFVQILRSGQVGRKSLGSLPKRLVQQWLERASVDQIIQAAIGSQPSLADVIRMVHPKPADAERAALYAWVMNKRYDETVLPAKLRAYEVFKADARQGAMPDMPFQYFTALSLDTARWAELAKRASWQTLRMNLNTFARHGVLDNHRTAVRLAERLRDPAQVRKARVFPYQLLTAYRAADPAIPGVIVDALQDAMEVATRQVPALQGSVVVAVDVSGSMASPVTGYRQGSTTATRCVDVAALIAASILRVRHSARIMPFDTEVRALRLNPRDSVMTQATQLASLCGGGTRVSAPLAQLNKEKAAIDLLVLVSDNESWRDTNRGPATATMQEWARIKQRCPQARMICIDLQPYATSQTVESPDVLHVGGFSDAVFELLAIYAAEGSDTRRWTERIASIPL
ncbi:vWA domain-containing protein [Dyella sp.]|uniref:vWA domain-containing protein n=1 Tax=Dyella sp. TaxID=1869338 RepID=UPI002ED38527